MSGSRALAPRMIGRQAQLQELDAHLAEAAAGSSRVVFLAGEAGVGKTRLVRAFLEHARTLHGVEILQGSCFEEQQPVAYGPLIDALSAIPDTQAMLVAAGPLSDELATLVPDLAATPSVAAAWDAQSRKRRLFEALYRVLRPQPGGRLRILVLEDLHWVDETSQEVIRFLARAGQHDPFLLLGTYRVDEVARQHPLARLILQLTRDRRLHEVPVPPLSQLELAQMLEVTLDRTIPSAMVTALHERTGGNPFFVEETLGALLERDQLDSLLGAAGRGIDQDHLLVPHSVKESILTRASDLDTTTAMVLRYAAVIGRHFDFNLLPRLTGLDEAALLGAVERLVERRLLVEDRNKLEDWFSFRHALTRAAIYENLLGRERRRMHRAVLQALEELNGTDQDTILDGLAHHSLQAREVAKAIRYGQQAGDRAARRYAYREAMGYFQTALGLQEDGDPRERAVLLEKLGEAAFPLGEAEVYERCWQQARQLYERAGDQHKVGTLYLKLSHAARDHDDHGTALTHISAGLAILEAEAPRCDLASAYNEMSALCWDSNRLQECFDWAEKALCLAATCPTEDVRVNAMINMGNALWDLGECIRAVECLERSLEAAQQGGLVQGALRAYMHLGGKLVGLGQFTRAAALFRESVVVAARYGWEARMWGDAAGLAWAEMELGHWREAHEAVAQTLSAADLGHPYGFEGLLVKAELLLRQGKLDEARQMHENLLQESETRGRNPFVWLALARIRLALGNHMGAREALDRVSQIWRDGGSAAAVEWWCMEMYLMAEHEEHARSLLPELVTHAERIPTPVTQAFIQDALGLAAAGARRHEEATTHFQQAADFWHEMEAPFYEAHSRRLRAESLLHGGDPHRREEAGHELTTAQRIFAALRAPLELEATQAMAGRHGLTPPAAAGRKGLLTRREREVIALIARGYSNRAIAEALVITEKTAEVHVGNILGKLGFTSRAQAAAYAVQQGLVITTTSAN